MGYNWKMEKVIGGSRISWGHIQMFLKEDNIRIHFCFKMNVIIGHNSHFISLKAVLGLGCTELTCSVLSGLSMALSFHPCSFFFVPFLSVNLVTSQSYNFGFTSLTFLCLPMLLHQLLVWHFTLWLIFSLKLSASSALVIPLS